MEKAWSEGGGYDSVLIAMRNSAKVSLNFNIACQQKSYTF